MTRTPKSAKTIVLKTGGKGLLREAVAVINPLDAIREITSAWSTAKRVAEEEQTKRARIAATERVDMARLQLQRDVLITYLERSFDERASNFKQLFTRLDRDAAASNTPAMAATLGAIVDLAKSSPLKALASVQGVRELMTDGSEMEL